MSDMPMDPATLAALLSMTGTGHGWPTKARAVAYIGSFEGGTEVRGPKLAGFLGISPGRARVLLAELEDERVIWRDGGGSERVFWCEVRPDWWNWRLVPWVVGDGTRADVEEKLAWWQPQAMQTARQRLDRASKGARYTTVIARLYARDAAIEAALEEARIARPRTRDNDDPGGGSSRAKSARSRDHLQLVHGRALIAGSPRSSSPPLGGGGSSCVTPPSEEELTPEHPDTPKLANALVKEALSNGWKEAYCRGEKRQMASALLDQAPLAVLLELLTDAPDGLGVPFLLGYLKDALDTEDPQSIKLRRIEKLRRRRPVLMRLVEQLGDTDPDFAGAPEELWSAQRELALLDNELEQLTAAEGAM